MVAWGLVGIAGAVLARRHRTAAGPRAAGRGLRSGRAGVRRDHEPLDLGDVHRRPHARLLRDDRRRRAVVRRRPRARQRRLRPRLRARARARAGALPGALRGHVAPAARDGGHRSRCCWSRCWWRSRRRGRELAGLPARRPEPRRRLRPRARAGHHRPAHWLGRARAGGGGPQPARRPPRRTQRDRLDPLAPEGRQRRGRDRAHDPRPARLRAGAAAWAAADLVAELRRNSAPTGRWIPSTAPRSRCSPTRPAGRGTGATPVRRAVRWIVRQQNRDGGFNFFAKGGGSGIDDTGAALQALVAGRPAQQRHGGTGAVRSCAAPRTPTAASRSSPGAPSNAQSTAWAVQGLVAGHANPDAVRRSGQPDAAGLPALADRRRRRRALLAHEPPDAGLGDRPGARGHRAQALPAGARAPFGVRIGTGGPARARPAARPHGQRHARTRAPARASGRGAAARPWLAPRRSGRRSRRAPGWRVRHSPR